MNNMKALSRLQSIAAIELSKRKPNYMSFFLDGKIVFAAPLVMTQTLSHIAKRISNEEAFKNQAEKYILIRSEHERLLSAYNKKIIGCPTDWRKNYLLLSSSLNSSMSFSEFVQQLIYNRMSGLFIDRHFVPQSFLYEPCFLHATSLEINRASCMFPVLKKHHLKSSAEVAGADKKNGLSSYEKTTLARYLSLW